MLSSWPPSWNCCVLGCCCLVFPRRQSDPNFPPTHFPSTFYLLYFNCCSCCSLSRRRSPAGGLWNIQQQQGRENIFLASGLWLWQGLTKASLPPAIFFSLSTFSVQQENSLLDKMALDYFYTINDDVKNHVLMSSFPRQFWCDRARISIFTLVWWFLKWNIVLCCV